VRVQQQRCTPAGPTRTPRVVAAAAVNLVRPSLTGQRVAHRRPPPYGKALRDWLWPELEEWLRAADRPWREQIIVAEVRVRDSAELDPYGAGVSKGGALLLTVVVLPGSSISTSPLNTTVVVLLQVSVTLHLVPLEPAMW
jgi:hypothetical protein